MKEKRRRTRYAVSDIEIVGTMVFASEVHILNVSISGVSITADRRLEIGAEYTLKLKNRSKLFSVKGTVIWATLSGTKKVETGDHIPVYRAGIRFTNVLNERINEILDFIGANMEGEEHRLLGLRFNIRENDTAILNIPEPYTVKKLSLGGMLILSKKLLPIEVRYPMELTLPEDHAISFLGRVASCIPVHDQGVENYDVGIEFLEMSDPDQQRLVEFIRFLQTLDVKTHQ